MVGGLALHQSAATLEAITPRVESLGDSVQVMLQV